MLSWPRATATLCNGPDTLMPIKRKGLQQLTYHKAELLEAYVFYAHGRSYTGRRLAPGVDDLERSVAHKPFRTGWLNSGGMRSTLTPTIQRKTI